MIFTETKLRGAFIIEIEKLEEEHGFFTRTWCEKEFESYELISHFVQCNINYSKKKGTIRGLHYQKQPYEEVKLIRCTKGAIFDVIIDLRPTSLTYTQWISVELTADNRRMLYVPKGFAHGFQTLDDDTEVFYPASQFYTPGAELGVRWNDPMFGIKWPHPLDPIVSDKNKRWKDYLLVGTFESDSNNFV